MRRAHGQGYVPLKRDIVDDVNDDLVEGLKSKTSALKSLTIDIGNEIREQKKLLDDLDDEFDKTGGLLSSTVGRVGRLLKAGHNRYILYLMLFSFFVFFGIYIIIKFR